MCRLVHQLVVKYFCSTRKKEHTHKKKNTLMNKKKNKTSFFFVCFCEVSLVSSYLYFPLTHIITIIFLFSFFFSFFFILFLQFRTWEAPRKVNFFHIFISFASTKLEWIQQLSLIPIFFLFLLLHFLASDSICPRGISLFSQAFYMGLRLSPYGHFRIGNKNPGSKVMRPLLQTHTNMH